jgi:hypothetical protein
MVGDGDELTCGGGQQNPATSTEGTPFIDLIDAKTRANFIRWKVLVTSHQIELIRKKNYRVRWKNFSTVPTTTIKH